MEESSTLRTQTPSFHLVLQEHPLAEPTYHDVVLGVTVSDIKNAAPSGEHGNDPILLVNGETKHGNYKPKKGDIVNFTFVPADGASAWLIYALIFVASAAISYALMPDIGDQQSGLSENETFDRITGLRNKNPLYEPYQAILGKRKVAPLYVARPFSKLEGDTEYFHALFSAGYGPLKLEDFRIGETLLEDFDDVELYVLDHYENTDESVIKDFWQEDIFQENVQIELNVGEGWTQRSSETNPQEIISNFFYPAGLYRTDDKGRKKETYTVIRQDLQDDSGDWWTPVEISPGYSSIFYTTFGTVREVNGQWVRWTTNGERVDLSDSSEVAANSITMTYAFVDDRANGGHLYFKNVPETVTLASLHTTDARPDPKFVSLKIPVIDDIWSSSSPINIRTQKYWPNDAEVENNNIISTVQWDNVQTIRPLTQAGFEEAIGYNRPLNYFDGTSVRTFRPTIIGLRMRATGQLSGNVDNFYVDATMCVPTDKDADWRNWPSLSLEPSTNPADAYKWIMQGPMNYSPIPIDKINHTELSAWRSRCVSENWTISALINEQQSLLAQLQNIAYVGRATFSFYEGKFGVVEKIERTVPRQIFTNKNSANFQSKRVYPEVVDGIKFQFESADVDYEQDEGVFLDPAKEADTTKLRGRYTTMDVWGVDNFDQAYRLSRFDYYETFLQRELYTLDVDIEVLSSRRGDLVRVQSDIISVGVGAGRIKSISGSVVTLDEQNNADTITSGGLQFRTNTGTVITTTADYLGNGQWDCDEVDSAINVGDLVVYGESGQETLDCIIRSIVYNEEFGATLTLVNSANEVFGYDGNPIPTYNPKLTLPVDTTKPPTPIIGATADRGVISVIVGTPNQTLAKSYTSLIQVRQYPIGRDADDYFATPNAGWSFVAQADNSQTSFSIENQQRGFQYQVRAQFRSSGGVASSWSNIEEVTLEYGVDLNTVDNLTYVHQQDGTYLLYSPVDDPEFDSFEIRTDTSFGEDDAGLVGRTKDNQFFLGLLTSDTTYYVAVKNNFSAYGASSSVSIITNVPSEPINFNASNEGYGTRLVWSKVSSGYAIDYFTLRYTDSNVGDDFNSSIEIGSTDGLTLTHTVASEGVYWYYIQAVDVAGNTSNWVSDSTSVSLATSSIENELSRLDTLIDTIDTTNEVTALTHRVSIIDIRTEDSELEILRSLSQQSASREELRNRIADGEVLIDAAVYIDPISGTIVNRAFSYTDDLFTGASLRIDGVEGEIELLSESISLVEGEVQDLSAELQLVPGQITATATSIVAEAISALEPAHSFNFFDSAQGWVAVNGTLTTPLPNQIHVTHGDIENYSLSFTAEDNPLIRLSITRTAGTGWTGNVIITRSNATTETFSGIIEDIPSGGEIVRTIDFRGITEWSGTITEVRLVLGASTADEFDISSIVIGKPEASVLELEELTSRVTQAELDINANEGTISQVVSDLQTFEGETEDNFTIVSSELDAVGGKIEDRIFSINGNRQVFEEDALSQLISEIEQTGYRYSDINEKINLADAVNQLQVDVSERGALAKSIESLEAISLSNGVAVQANTSAIQEVSTDVEGNAEAINLLDTRVESTEGFASSQLILNSEYDQTLGTLSARAFLGTNVNDQITGVVIDDSGTEQTIEFISDSVKFLDGDGEVKIYYDFANTRYVFAGAIEAEAGSFTGSISSAEGEIGGWAIESNFLSSAASGKRIQLDSNNSRISVFDAVNEKVAMGYLDGLPKNDGTGNWGSNDYGFWARSGDSLAIDGNLEYTNGDFLVQNDASVSIINASNNEIVRLGTDSGEKGTFIYDTSGNKIAQFSSSKILIGDATDYMSWDATNGLVVSGQLNANVGLIGGWTIDSTSLTNGTSSIDSSNSTISLGDDVLLSPDNVAFGDSFAWNSITGLLVDSDAEIAGWEVTTGIFRSDSSGARVELNSTKNRVSIFDAVNEKVAMGYLGGLPKFDGSGSWASNAYGFWARQGDTLVIDGNVDYNNGDFIVQNDSSIKIRDGVTDNEILRVGTDAGEKGFFLYDANVSDGSSSNLLSKFTSDSIYIGSDGEYISWDSSNGLEVSGKITVGTQIGTETISELQSRTTFAANEASSAKSLADSAQSDVDTLSGSLGGLAYDDLVESAKLGTTIIDGGYIKPDLLDVDTILGVNATFSGALNAVTGTLGTLTVESTGYVQTAPYGTTGSGPRVKLTGPSNNSPYSIWVGEGVENDDNGLFYVTKSGTVTYKGNLNVKSANSGERTEITNSEYKVYDSSGTLRVRMGVW